MDKQIVNRFYCLAESMKKVMVTTCHMGRMSKSEFAMLHLIKLCESELDVVTTAVLSEQLHISKPAVSRMINVLEGKEYLTREINKSDRRLMSISLTETGKKKLEEEKGKFLSRLDAILDKMGKEESVILIGLMERYFEVVKEVVKGDN